MRLLWASQLVPYPPKSGVHQRSYHLLRGVAAEHEVDLIAFVQEPWLRIFYRSREDALEDCERELRRFCRSVRFVDIDRLKRPYGKWRTALESLTLPECYTIRWLQSPASWRAFATVAAQEKYSLVHFDTLGLAPFRSLFAGVPATLDHHNIESHMMLRRAANEPNPVKRWYFRQEGKRIQKYEQRIAGSFDAHITCSELDAARLRSLVPQAKVAVVPNGVDIKYFQPTSEVGARRALIFVGNLNWYPNIAAVRFLLSHIWPSLKAAVPDLHLDIVGSAPPPGLCELAAAAPDVTMHGYVADVRPLMSAATLYVCPIRDGGGTKLKLLDAFAMRKCVVAHPIACEGIEAIPGRHVEFAESAESFVERIRHLLNEPHAREEIGRAARQLVVERYAFDAIAQRLSDLFASLAEPASRAEDVAASVA